MIVRLRINKILKLFTDSSVNPQSNIGYGAYLIVLDDEVVNDIKIKSAKITIYTDC